MNRRRGFTLLEICLAILIAVILMTMAIPSISGFVADQRLRSSFEEFDNLVHEVQNKAVLEHRPFVLVWEDAAVVARPIDPKDANGNDGVARMEFGKDAECAIDLPASLIEKPDPVWIFWPTGTCEPAKIFYKGPHGTWAAEYNPLTLRANLVTNGKKP